MKGGFSALTNSFNRDLSRTYCVPGLGVGIYLGEETTHAKVLGQHTAWSVGKIGRRPMWLEQSELEEGAAMRCVCRSCQAWVCSGHLQGVVDSGTWRESSTPAGA